MGSSVLGRQCGAVKLMAWGDARMHAVVVEREDGGLAPALPRHGGRHADAAAFIHDNVNACRTTQPQQLQGSWLVSRSFWSCSWTNSWGLQNINIVLIYVIIIMD